MSDRAEIDRSREASSSSDLVDVVDEWVHDGDADVAATDLLDLLPKAIIEAMRRELSGKAYGYREPAAVRASEAEDVDPWKDGVVEAEMAAEVEVAAARDPSLLGDEGEPLCGRALLSGGRCPRSFSHLGDCETPARIPQSGEVWVYKPTGEWFVIGQGTIEGPDAETLYRVLDAKGNPKLAALAFLEFLKPPEPFSLDEQEIELVITDHAFEPNYSGWTIQFQAVGAPRLAHQSSDPSLEAFVRLEVADKDTLRLTAGAGKGGALARRAPDSPGLSALAPLNTSPEGNILAMGFNALSVDTGETVKEIPVALPSEEKMVEAMKKSLAVHLDKVREERARLKVTETAAGVVGKRFRVRM